MTPYCYGGGMRVTIRLDPEVAAAERLRRERGMGLGEAVNELARAGLSRTPVGARRMGCVSLVQNESGSDWAEGLAVIVRVSRFGGVLPTVVHLRSGPGDPSSWEG